MLYKLDAVAVTVTTLLSTTRMINCGMPLFPPCSNDAGASATPKTPYAMQYSTVRRSLTHKATTTTTAQIMCTETSIDQGDSEKTLQYHFCRGLRVHSHRRYRE